MNNNFLCHSGFYRETEYLFDRTFSCQVALKEVEFELRKRFRKHLNSIK